jgi:hypothetical protein
MNFNGLHGTTSFCSLQNKTLPENKHVLPNFLTLIVSEKVDTSKTKAFAFISGNKKQSSMV